MIDWKASGFLQAPPDCPPYSKVRFIIIVIVIIIFITLQFQADEVGGQVIRIVADGQRWTGNDRLVLTVNDVAA
jgi:hypothetical protein